MKALHLKAESYICSKLGYRHLRQPAQQSHKKWASFHHFRLYTTTNHDPAYAVKALKELHDKNIIAGKAVGNSPYLSRSKSYFKLTFNPGKQTVYHALQDPKDAISSDELVAMDKRIQELRESITTAKANEKSLKASLITVNATMSVGDFRTSIIALESEKEELLARLGPLRAATVKPVSTEEKCEVEKAWREWSRKATVRRKICMELWDFCTEEMQEGKTREDLWVRRVLYHVHVWESSS